MPIIVNETSKEFEVWDDSFSNILMSGTYQEVSDWLDNEESKGKQPALGEVIQAIKRKMKKS